MKCKACKQEIADNSIFCNFCGYRQVKERKAEPKIAKPRRLKSGTYFGQVMKDGERISVSAKSEKEYYQRAREIKEGNIRNAVLTLSQACESYLDKRSNVLSPSTIRGYNTIKNTRFQKYMKQKIDVIEYQKMINDEVAEVSAKTVTNAWGLVKAVLKENGIEPPAVTLPQVVKKEQAWLQPNQIPIFLNEIKGRSCELGALFALQGLRRSEIYALKPSDIRDGIIHIEGAAVRDSDGNKVIKETNKNTSSRRTVAIKIPRLQQLIDEYEGSPDEPFINCKFETLYAGINRACERAGLPLVGVHGLRRTFASLAYSLGWNERETMREGGWSDKETMNKIYIKLAQSDIDRAENSMSKFYAQI